MKFKAWVLTAAMTITTSLSQLALAEDVSGAVEEKPSMLAMTGDFLIVRPVMLATTVVGTALWLVSSPFSLMGGNFKEAGETLALDPAKATFSRCLGCVGEGYKPAEQ